MPKVAYRTVRSNRKFINSPKVKAVLEKALESEAKPKLIRRFKMVVSNWKTSVNFRARKLIKNNNISIYVFPAGSGANIWRYVSRGTRPHIIRAKRAAGLFFMGGGKYKPKTKPVGKFGGPGIVIGGSPVKKQSVNHPGNEARKFEEAIADDFKKEFSRIMKNAWRRAIRRL